MMKLRNLVYVFVFFLTTAHLGAQSFTAAASPDQVSMDESFNVEYSLDQDGQGFKSPDFKDFIVLAGPMSSSEISIVNGHRSFRLSYTFTLQPRHAGKIVIPPASITAGGHRVFSNSVEVTVTPGGSGTTTRTGKGLDNVSGSKNKNIFLLVIASKDHVMTGEAVTLTYKLYVGDLNHQQLESCDLDHIPSYEGFWVEDEKIPFPPQANEERYKGKTYETILLKKVILFPQKSGQIPIDPIQLTAEVQGSDAFDFNWNTDPRDLFKSMEPTHIAIKSDPMVVNVDPLPTQGRPADFNGFVGQASASAELDAKKPRANEALTYTLTIQGAGNMNLLPAPKLNIPGNAEVYDPVVQQKLVKGNDNIMGSKTFTYTIIPRSQGRLEIPAQHFSYYNPDSHSYETSTTQPFSVEVAPGEKYNEHAEKQQPVSMEQHKPVLPVSLIVSLATGISALALFIFLLLRKKTHAPEAPQPEVVISPKDRLAEARTYLDAQNRERFYTAIQEALYTFIHQETGLPRADIEQDNIRQALNGKNYPAEKTESILLLLERVEFAKYAPAGSHFMEERGVLAEAERLMQ